MSGGVTDRGLLRAALALALTLFVLLVAYRFLAGIAMAALSLVAGVLLAVALSGPVEALHRRKVPRSVSSASIAAGALAVLGVGGYLLAPGLDRQVSQLVSTIPDVLSQLAERIERLASRFGVPVGDVSSFLPSASTLVGWGRQVLGGGLALFGDLTAALLGLVVVLFLALYLAATPEPAVEWTLRFLPPERRPRARAVLWKVRTNLLGWLKGRLISMGIIGALSTGALYLIGIPAPLLLGIFAGLVAFVPYVGPVISVVPPALLGLAGEPVDALWVLLAYLLIQQIESYLITPLIMSGMVSLHPAAVIVAVALLGAAFGVLGALLAIPVAVVAKVLIEELWFGRMEQDGPSGDAAPDERASPEAGG